MKKLIEEWAGDYANQAHGELRDDNSIGAEVNAMDWRTSSEDYERGALRAARWWSERWREHQKCIDYDAALGSAEWRAYTDCKDEIIIELDEAAKEMLDEK